ncbi:DUF2235 domain-containing protein [Azospirillum soli]|uniref:DUF2235 domain-containing protein n=1 Tax=Azospirillum soli TaxID=1304799 RepID=UPI001AE7B92D|nr:DUF2235 domain-containing protein [Azospirillum soli]MBP2315327.1 uncharacterized protein (DUF2235 family) [Azospirillum soli]
MAKNVVVCCDGTANEFATNRTNVAKLFFTLVKNPIEQAVHYHPGVGTMEPPGALTRTGALLTRTAGLAFGYGLDRDVRDAYTFIADTFEDGDKLFLFGFSRGAYTVRAVAALLYMYGLIPKGNAPLVPYAVRMMWAINRLRRKRRPGDADDPRIDEYFRLAADFKVTFSRVCKPHFVGVWDTVSSVGWFTSPVSLPYTTYNSDIAIGRHAVAIDERRAFYRTHLWRLPPDANKHRNDIKQVWFPGVHCDVGGGYPEAESGLSKFPLEWMIAEAEAAGLKVDGGKVATILGRSRDGYARPDPDALLHQSMRGLWHLAEYAPKPHWNGQATQWRASLNRPRSWPERPLVHRVAWERDGGRYATRLPADAVKYP